MKKLFSLIAVAFAAIALNATVVELKPSDFSAAENAATSATVDGVSAAITTGTITSDQIRIFKNQTITISCESPISAIEFFCTASGDAKYGPGCFAAQDGYSFEGNIGAWIGEAATSVAFTASSNQVRATKIKVYLDGETPAAKEIQKVNVAGAIAAGMALDSMATSELVYEVTGYVVDAQEYSLQYKNQIWFMADDAENTGAQEFEAYSCIVKENGETLQVIDGDKVVLTGALTKYYDAANSKYIIEIKNGTAEFVEKAEGDHSLPVLQVDTISVAQAVEIANALEEPAAAGSSTTDPNTYVVAGFAVSVYDKNSDGSWSFYMADEAGVKGNFMASSTTTDADVEKDDFMYVTGKIAKFKSSKGNIILQIYKGTGEHGEGPAPAELDTITAAEAKTRCEALPVDGTEKVAVLCLIASIKTAYDADHGNITVWLNDDPASTYGDIQAYRAKCSEEDGTALAPHDKVLVVGNLSHTTYEKDGETRHSYQIAAGAELTLVEKAQGIENILLTEKVQKVIVDGVVYIVRDGKLFNIQGAQVR